MVALSYASVDMSGQLIWREIFWRETCLHHVSMCLASEINAPGLSHMCACAHHHLLVLRHAVLRLARAVVRADVVDVL